MDKVFRVVISRRAILLAPLALLGAGKKPNVILVIARGWRGVATPWSGDVDVQAPNLTKFGENAVVFPRAYAAIHQNEPRGRAFPAGRYPHVNGVITDGAPMRSEEVTIESVLKVSGYRQLDGIVRTRANAPSPLPLSIDLEAPRSSKPADGSSSYSKQCST